MKFVSTHNSADTFSSAHWLDFPVVDLGAFLGMPLRMITLDVAGLVVTEDASTPAIHQNHTPLNLLST